MTDVNFARRDINVKPVLEPIKPGKKKNTPKTSPRHQKSEASGVQKNVFLMMSTKVMRQKNAVLRSPKDHQKRKAQEKNAVRSK